MTTHAAPATSIKAQQEQLQRLLAQHGETVPLASIPAFAPNDPLFQFLLAKLTDAVQHDADQPASDLSTVADQNSSLQGASKPWIDLSPSEDVQLEEARATERELQAQLRDLQAAERAMTSALQDTQLQQANLTDTLSVCQTQLVAARSQLNHVNEQLNQQLQVLLNTVQELETLICARSSSWLVLAADKTQYKRVDDAFNHQLGRFLDSIDLRVSTRAGSGAAAPVSTEPLSPQEWGSHTHSEGRRFTELSQEECDALMQEMQRLKAAYCLGEMEEMSAKAKLAGLKAQAHQLRVLLEEQSQSAHSSAGVHHQYAPWLQPAECERLASRVQELQHEANKLARVKVPALIDEVGKLQDVHVLKGLYELRHSRSVAGVRERQAVVDALLTWSTQNQVLDKLRLAERKTLGQLYRTVEDLRDALSEVRAAAELRCTHYLSVPTGSNSTGAHTRASDAADARGSAGNSAALRDRQQLEEGGWLDQLYDALQQPQRLAEGAAERGSVGAVIPAPATLRNLTLAAQEVQAALGSAQGSVAQACRGQLPELVDTAAHVLQSAHDTLCGPGTEGFQPILVDPQLTAAHAEVESIKTQLQNTCNDIVNASNAVLSYGQAHQERINTERSVLYLFYTDPEKLNDKVQELQERLDALQATLS